MSLVNSICAPSEPDRHSPLTDPFRPAAWWHAVLATAVAATIWLYPSQAVTDALVWGAFLYALFRWKRGAAAWRCNPGAAFILVIAYTAATLPFGEAPALAGRDFLRFARLLAGAFAIPVILHTRYRIAMALLGGALAVALILAADLVRLGSALGGDLLTEARLLKPYVMNHPNVASMMAAMAFLVFAGFVLRGRRLPRWLLGACIAGLAVTLLYQYVIASRGPQIAFAAACAASGFLLRGWKAKLGWAVLGLAAVLLLVTHAETINRRFADRRSMAGFSDRDKVWLHTWKLAVERPWLGYGFGKQTFQRVYRASNPPRSRFEFPHPHQYWLATLFQGGRIGVALHMIAWTLLAIRLVRFRARTPHPGPAALAGILLLMLFCLHVYGLGDMPDNRLQMLLVWLVPLALAATRDRPELASDAAAS